MIIIETFTRSSISATVEGCVVYSLPKCTAMALQTSLMILETTWCDKPNVFAVFLRRPLLLK